MDLELSRNTAPFETERRRQQFSHATRPHLLFIGNWHRSLEMLVPLYEDDHTITLMHTIDEIGDNQPLPYTFLILELTHETPLPHVAILMHQFRLPWIVWNRTDYATLTLAAYQAGARAVLPSSTNASALRQTLYNSMNSHSEHKNRLPFHSHQREKRHYQPNERIYLDQESVLEVLQGIVALTVLHPDGTQVLLGLCGQKQMLVGHPDDECYIQVITHTAATIILHPWNEVIKRQDFPTQLRSRLRFMEAWASIQARPYLDRRLLGIFSLLADQFGVQHEQGTLIDLRITHTQLASTVGASRTTITRLLGHLHRQGLLITIGAGSNKRFCLRQRDSHAHNFG